MGIEEFKSRFNRVLRPKNGGTGKGSKFEAGDANSSRTSRTLLPESKTTAEAVRDSHASAADSDTIEPDDCHIWTESIPLKSFRETPHSDPGVAKAQDKLKESIEKLGAALQNYASKSTQFWAMTDQKMTSGVLQGLENDSTHCKVFQGLIEQILDGQEKQKDKVSSRVASFMVKLIPVANIALGFVFLGPDAGGLLPLKFTANGVTQLLTIAKDHQSRSEMVIKQLEKLEGCQTLLESMRSAKLDDSNPAKIMILKNATNLLTSINDFLRISLGYLNTSVLKRFGKAIIYDDDMTESMKKFNEALDAFEKSLNAAASIVILQQNQAQELEKTLNFLSEMDFKVVQDDIRKKRTPGTGRWLLEVAEFKKWWEEETRLLWCPGKGGSGKTVLTSMVIDHICPEFNSTNGALSTGLGIAYVYCDYNRQTEQTALNLIKSIVRQFVQRDLSVNKNSSLSLAKAFQEKHNYMTPTLEDYRGLILSIMKRFRKTVVVVDALDECAVHLDGHLNRAKFIECLRALPDLKLLITSRNLPEIADLLRGAVEIPIQPRADDILSYVESRIENGPIHYCITPELKEEILNTIKKKYSEIFVLVRLLLDSIWTMDTVGEVRRALKTLPTTTNGFYGLSIKRIKDGDNPGRAMKILAWIFHAKRALKVMELRHALAVQAKNTSIAVHKDFLVPGEVLVNCCAGLILVAAESRIVAFSHPTVKEYLETDEVSKELFDFEPDVYIARTCLTYLCYDAFSEDLKDMKAQLQRFPFLNYAVFYWSHHLRGGPEKELKELALCFLDNVPNFSNFKQVWNSSVLFNHNDMPLFRSGMTGLHIAAYFGLGLIVSSLLAYKDVDVNLQDKDGWTALWLAAMYGRGAVVKQLLAHKDIDVNRPDKYGRMVLWLAAENGQDTVEQLLAHKDIDVNLQDKDGETALSRAAENGHIVVVKQLLAHKNVDVNLQDKYGWTALSRAGKNRHDAVVKQLLTHKNINVNLQDRYSWTALSQAADNGHNAVVKQLLAHKDVEVNLQDKYGWTALWWAAFNGRDAAVEQLLAHKDVHVNLQDKFGQTALLWAAFNGHDAIVKQLLAHKDIEIDLQDKYGLTALLWAVVNGRDAVVEQLLAHKDIDVDLQDKYGWTALWWAAEKGHNTVVKQLLAHKDVDVNLQDKDGQTALWQAAEKGHNAVVKQLLAHKDIDVNLQDKDGQTALSRAVKNGHNAVVKQLLAHQDVNVSLYDKDGQTALWRAAENGCDAIVKQLLARKDIDVNLQDQYSQTALLWAAAYGHDIVVKQLLAHKDVNVNFQDEDGRTALLWAAGYGHDIVVKQLLAHKDVDVNLQDERSQTALSWAAVYGYDVVVERLLAHKDVDVNLQDKDSWTALSWAAAYGHNKVVKRLLARRDIDVNLQDKDSCTALLWAAGYGHDMVVKQLLERKDVDINLQDKDRRTALWRAAENGHEAIVKQLLAHKGVDVEVPDKNGRTALSWAAENGHDAVVKLLES